MQFYEVSSLHGGPSQVNMYMDKTVNEVLSWSYKLIAYWSTVLHQSDPSRCLNSTCLEKVDSYSIQTCKYPWLSTQRGSSSGHPIVTSIAIYYQHVPRGV